MDVGDRYRLRGVKFERRQPLVIWLHGGGWMSGDKESDVDGAVEIAYFTFPGFEGQGYATAMAEELLARALQSGDVREVIAHTLPEHNASTRVLENVGLHRAGEANDDEVGRVWQWRYRVAVCEANHESEDEGRR